MHNQYTDLLLDLPEVKTEKVLEVGEQTLHVEVSPVAHKQACPQCRSLDFVIRKGSNPARTIRHGEAFGKSIYVRVPAIRLFCKQCQCGFVWQYTFVDSGKRYSHAFEKQAIRTATAATVKHSADLHAMPASTLQTKYQHWLALASERLQERVWQDAACTSKLVLGVDDFAIRKGHTYNTGIHNLRGEALLDILPGRKLEELRAYAKQHSFFFGASSHCGGDGSGSVLPYLDSGMLSEGDSYCGSLSCSSVCDRGASSRPKNDPNDAFFSSESEFESQASVAKPQRGVLVR